MPVTSDTLRGLEARIRAMVEEFEAIKAQVKAEEETSARGLFPPPRTLTRQT